MKPTKKQILDFALKTEEQGEDFYRKMAVKFEGNPEVTKLFKQLAGDEVVHQRQFEELKTNLPEIDWDDVARDEHDRLNEVLTSSFFDTTEGPFKDLDLVESRDDVLALALNFERATLNFYNAVAGVIRDYDQTLNSIIDSEKQHVSQVLKIATTGAKYRGMQDQWP